MREFLFVLVVILVLLGLTAIRYRKYIVSLIGLAKVLKEVKQGVGSQINAAPTKGDELVNCIVCGVWIPKPRALILDRQTYCSKACQKAAQPLK